MDDKKKNNVHRVDFANRKDSESEQPGEPGKLLEIPRSPSVSTTPNEHLIAGGVFPGALPEQLEDEGSRLSQLKRRITNIMEGTESGAFEKVLKGMMAEHSVYAVWYVGRRLLSTRPRYAREAIALFSSVDDPKTHGGRGYWIQQLLYSPYVEVRRDAARALKDFGDDLVVQEALRCCLSQESNEEVRACLEETLKAFA